MAFFAKGKATLVLKLLSKAITVINTGMLNKNILSNNIYTINKGINMRSLALIACLLQVGSLILVIKDQGFPPSYDTNAWIHLSIYIVAPIASLLFMIKSTSGSYGNNHGNESTARLAHKAIRNKLRKAAGDTED